MLSRAVLQELNRLSQELSLSVAGGELTYLEHGWYVTHAGLLRLARNNRCVGIDKRLPEIQYLRSTITEEQRRDFGQLVEDTVAQIEAAQFIPHPGIRFPQNGCTSCPYLGLCLQNQPLVESKLLRRPGGDLGWLDELEY